jgi:hypothetical protein
MAAGAADGVPLRLTAVASLMVVALVAALERTPY